MQNNIGPTTVTARTLIDRQWDHAWRSVIAYRIILVTETEITLAMKKS